MNSASTRGERPQAKHTTFDASFATRDVPDFARVLNRWLSARGFSCEWVVVARRDLIRWIPRFVNEDHHLDVVVRHGTNEGVIVAVLLAGWPMVRLKTFDTLADAWKMGGALASALVSYHARGPGGRRRRWTFADSSECETHPVTGRPRTMVGQCISR